MTATHFAWAILGGAPFPPPEPQRGERYGPDARCWLCGGPTGGVGWPWKTAVAETFTNHTLAACPTSQTICQPCAAFASKDAWEAYAARRPELGLKTGHAMSWRCYSHLFASPDRHECPTRRRWRDILLDPPEPPFLAVVATSGQKHLIFRGRIAENRDAFPVQVEERILWLEREEFVACLAAFEQLYNLGFSKDDILTGRYFPARMLAVGTRAWRAAEDALAPFRRWPALLTLTHFVAQRAEIEEMTPEKGGEGLSCSTVLTPMTRLRQPGLF